MSINKYISIIAPEPIGSAFSVLIDSLPHHCVLGSADNLDDLITCLGKKEPNMILVYLSMENGSDQNEAENKTITRIKDRWPDVECLAVVQRAAQVIKALENGADLVFLEGVSAARLLEAIEGKLT